jgi:hypothetical protein
MFISANTCLQGYKVSQYRRPKSEHPEIVINTKDHLQIAHRHVLSLFIITSLHYVSTVSLIAQIFSKQHTFSYPR